MRHDGQGEAGHVLTLHEARTLLRADSDEGARKWIKAYAPGAILPGGRLRISRARLIAIIDGRVPAEHPKAGA